MIKQKRGQAMYRQIEQAGGMTAITVTWQDVG